jgi:hypothetical protein
MKYAAHALGIFLDIVHDKSQIHRQAMGFPRAGAREAAPARADASFFFDDCEHCPQSGNRANGGLSCMGNAPLLPAGCVQYERATVRFDGLINACIVKRARSK